MTTEEPINLKEWRPATGHKLGEHLFTCGRPGRGTFGKARVAIGFDTIDRWINGLPKADVLFIISLLGRKKNGYSEFEYYPFKSSEEAGTKPTVQDWLEKHYPRRFVVYEFPTVDATKIPQHVLEEVKQCILNLIKKSSTIIIVDSAGAERTARVCEAIGYKQI